ncbi:MAG: AAA family ATPase [bacterium]
MERLLVEKVKIDWEKIPEDSYVRQIDALKGVEEITLSAPVTYFVGENGSGKSTLLEALAIQAGFNPEGGTRNYCFSTYDSHASLHEALTFVRSPRRIRWGYFLRAESFYNVATMEEEYREMPEYYHYQSHGEAFLALADSHFQKDGLYFLDEPEAALSPARQLSLLVKIYECAKQGAQFIIASHSPILLGLPDAALLSFDDGPLHPICYEETAGYQMTALFINHRERMLCELLGKDEKKEIE